jgi:hypothetical protein
MVEAAEHTFTTRPHARATGRLKLLNTLSQPDLMREPQDG